MIVRQRFGEFLVNSGLVDENSIFEALNFQKERTTAIGQIALQKRKLTIKQVFQILNAQQDTSKRFGEIAEELGFLSSKDVMALLEAQNKSRPRLGDILVIRKNIDREAMQKALIEFLAINAI